MFQDDNVQIPKRSKSLKQIQNYDILNDTQSKIINMNSSYYQFIQNIKNETKCNQMIIWQNMHLLKQQISPEFDIQQESIIIKKINQDINNINQMIPQNNSILQWKNTSNMQEFQSTKYDNNFINSFNDFIKQNDNKPIIQGFLGIPSVFQGIQEVYAHLLPESLKIYKNIMAQDIIHCLDFRFLNCEVQLLQFNQFCIKIKDTKHVIVYKVVGKCDINEWFNQINLCIHKFKNKKNYLDGNLYIEQYFNRASITEMEFKKIAKSGDLLLFQTDNIAAKLQRKFTFSEFDHVSLVIKLQGEKDPFIFESQEQKGVNLLKWNTYIQSNNLFSKVVFRPLNKKLTDTQYIKLMDFVYSQCGVGYELNIKKLLGKKSLGDDFDQKEVKGFFCSELIAGCYKQAGIFETDKSCNQFWPGDFSEDKSIKLINQLGFNQQISIIIERQLKTN